jgi:hypothetical protein
VWEWGAEACLLYQCAFMHCICWPFHTPRAAHAELTCAGRCRCCCAVMAAIIILGESFSTTSAFGLVVVIIGVLMFNLIKYEKLKKGEIKAVTMSEPPHRSESQEVPDDVDFEVGPESPTARLLEQHKAIQQLPGGIPALASGVVLHHR